MCVNLFSAAGNYGRFVYRGGSQLPSAAFASPAIAGAMAGANQVRAQIVTHNILDERLKCSILSRSIGPCLLEPELVPSYGKVSGQKKPTRRFVAKSSDARVKVFDGRVLYTQRLGFRV